MPLLGSLMVIPDRKCKSAPTQTIIPWYLNVALKPLEKTNESLWNERCTVSPHDTTSGGRSVPLKVLTIGPDKDPSRIFRCRNTSQ